jgi:hypothetical protein
MQESCNAARSDTIKRIKDNTTAYLNAGQTPIIVDEVQIREKPLRGFNNPEIGRLLVPAEDVHE